MMRSQHLSGVVVWENCVRVSQLSLKVSWKRLRPSMENKQGNPVCIRQLKATPEALSNQAWAFGLPDFFGSGNSGNSKFR